MKILNRGRNSIQFNTRDTLRTQTPPWLKETSLADLTLPCSIFGDRPHASSVLPPCPPQRPSHDMHVWEPRCCRLVFPIKMDNYSKSLSSSGHLSQSIFWHFFLEDLRLPPMPKYCTLIPDQKFVFHFGCIGRVLPCARVMSTWTGHDSSLRKQVGAALGLRTYIHTYAHKNSLVLSLVCLQIRKLLCSLSISSSWA